MERFKRSFSTALAVTLIALAFVVMIGLTESANAQKAKPAIEQITSADLDHAFVQGATVKYQLEDGEIFGEPLTYSNGTVVRRVNATIIVDYTAIDARRDEQGRRLYRVKVDRPDFLGGPFERDAPFNSGRSPGTIDTIKAGDLVH